MLIISTKAGSAAVLYHPESLAVTTHEEKQ
jgi:hypothetical protein